MDVLIWDDRSLVVMHLQHVLASCWQWRLDAHRAAICLPKSLNHKMTKSNVNATKEIIICVHHAGSGTGVSVLFGTGGDCGPTFCLTAGLSHLCYLEQPPFTGWSTLSDDVCNWGWALEDLVEVVLVAFAIPLLIMLLGLPVVLLIRLAIEIAHRL